MCCTNIFKVNLLFIFSFLHSCFYNVGDFFVLLAMGGLTRDLKKGVPKLGAPVLVVVIDE